MKSLKEAGITKVPVAVEASGWGELIGAIRNSGLADKGLNNIVEEIDKAIATGNDPDFKVRDIAAALMSPGMTRSRLRAKIRHGIGFPDGNGGSTISDAKIDELFEESELYNWAEDEDLSNAIGEIIPKTISEKLGFLPMDIGNTSAIKNMIGTNAPASYWLNEPHPNDSSMEGYINENGNFAYDGVGEGSYHGLSPAFVLDSRDILFSSVVS